MEQFSRMLTERIRFLVAAALAVLFLVGMTWVFHSATQVQAEIPAAAHTGQFTSETQCAACHAAETAAWKKSHHAQAMAVATRQTVLGDFNDAVFEYNGIRSRFFRKDDGFWVETDGPDGRLGTFKVAYTFGIAPLQQYLIAMPGGRLQALGIAWDTEGKRWYHLYPQSKLTFRDDLHWTKPQQNANFMCIECHVTDFKRNFSVADNSFASTWQELGVGCQACHGPAERHLAWATGPDKDKPLPGSGFEVPLKAASQQTIIEACGRCHARRAPLGDGYSTVHRLSDDYAVSLLTDQLYHVDGQIKDEVFEYGSFTQSKMFMAGVSCVNCHDAHSGTVRVSGNALCLSCHGTDEKLRNAELYIQPVVQKNYDSPDHTHHDVGASGSYCVDCHMPGKYYMGDDFRRDHSLRIPRPDLATRLAVPDACTDCHAEQTPQWAAQQVEAWFGKKGKDDPLSYGEVVWGLRHGSAGAIEALSNFMQSPDSPPIRRATALSEATRYPGGTVINLMVKSLRDNDPLVRAAAVASLTIVPPEARMPVLAPLLDDPVLQVRITVARSLTSVRSRLDTARQASWHKAIDEYRAVQNALSERAESHVNLAGLAIDLGQRDVAARELDIALKLDPDFLPAVVMKAEYLAATGQSAAGLAQLREALTQHPDSALLNQALGLALIRAGDRTGALQSLRTAWEKAPDNPSYGYIYAVALHDTGDRTGAIAQLDKVMAAHPESRDAAMIAIRYRMEVNDSEGAQAIAQRWLKVSPDEPSLSNPARRATPPQ